MIKMSLSWKCRVGSISVIISIINHINGLKDKNHMSTLIDTGKKNLWQNTCFLDKSPRKNRTVGNIIKAIYDKPTANIILNQEKLGFTPKLGVRQSCPLSQLFLCIIVL